MRNSVGLWLLSAAVSMAAHAGALAALSRISLPEPPEQQPFTELLVSNAGADSLFQTEVVSASTATEVNATAAPDLVAAQQAASKNLEPKADDVIAALPGGTLETAMPEELAAQDSAAPDGMPSQAPQSPLSSEAVEPSGAGAAIMPGITGAALVGGAPSPSLAPDAEGVTIASTPSLPSAPAASTQVTPQLPDVAQPAGAANTTSPLPASQGRELSQGNSGPVAIQSQTSPRVAGGSASEVAALDVGPVTAAAPASETSTVANSEALAPIENSSTAVETQIASATTLGTQALTQAERISRFLQTQSDRPCLYAKPGNLTAGRPTFTGYGAGDGRIGQFAEAFQQAVGVDPRLAIRPVMQAQCPAVDFIRALRGGAAGELAVIIDHQEINDRGNLVGRLEGKLAEYILLLLIDDDGAVQDLSSKLLRKGDKNVFAEAVTLRGEGRARFQMLLALTSAAPLRVNAAHQPGEALAVFDLLRAQVREGGGGIALGIASFRVN